MAIRGITFSKQAVSSNDDSHVYKVLLNGREGKTKGCRMTYGSDDIYISDGYFFAANRLIAIPSAETISTPVVSSGTTYCRLVFEINLAKTNTNAEFNQGAFKILSSTSGYPALTQEDLENGGNVYQMPFAMFTKSVSGIGSFVSELEIIGHVAGNATIYVSTSGNDASGDGSSNLPFKTVQKAINSIPKDLNNREITINIASGTYSENVEIAGFYGGTLRIACGTVSLKSLTVYEANVIITGTQLTLAANGLSNGFYCHRGANIICQINLIVNGSTNGIIVSYGSRFSGKNVTINSCTIAVLSSSAAYVAITALTGSKNNNGISASAGIVSIGTIDAALASTLYVTAAGGRIFAGSQASVPNY